ncbi:MarC family protein [Solirhodobacter olei]|uniref:MarC family protein n=1 Tax=Solirhodobacter olei TaxID=2493082 RepID=UPI000FD8C31D|nr:MarC family protein [Solirhodobacter olei]
MDRAQLVTAFVTLFVVIEPIGITPMFIALTRGMSTRQRRTIGLRACVTAVGILTAFGLLGQSLLNFVGISIPAFRISGGILLFLTALDMLFERRTQRREGQVEKEEDDHDPSVFPLAMPLLAGPGALTTMILLVGQVKGGWVAILELHIAMVAVVGIAFALFQVAGPLDKALGRTGNNVITRLLGMLLAALSVQFVIDGVRAAGVLPGL